MIDPILEILDKRLENLFNNCDVELIEKDDYGYTVETEDGFKVIVTEHLVIVECVHYSMRVSADTSEAIEILESRLRPKNLTKVYLSEDKDKDEDEEDEDFSTEDFFAAIKRMQADFETNEAKKNKYYFTL